MGHAVPFVHTKGDRNLACRGNITYLTRTGPLAANPNQPERLSVGGRTGHPGPVGRRQAGIAKMPTKGTPQ